MIRVILVIMTNSQDLFARFLNSCDTIIPEDARGRLSGSKPLTIKFGADPSAPDLHLGHYVVLKQLRRLQDLGHHVQFIIGDFTAMIGDPTGKSDTRPALSQDDVDRNAASYQDQVFRVLNPDQTTVYYNSDWLRPLSSQDMIRLASHYNVARMLERDDFHKRYQSGQSIRVHEFLYPLLQGYDSVHLKSDVEIGGTDQTFNLLMGRHLQKEYGLPHQQAIITCPILEGLDGVKKMSKSLNNHIGIHDAPNDMFGKVMSIPDPLIIPYFTYLTDVSSDELADLKQQLADGKNPKHLKEALGVAIVSQFHDESVANNCVTEFNQVFANKEQPTDIPPIDVANETTRLDQLMMAHKLMGSKKEIHRLIKQGAVSIDGESVQDPFYSFTPQDGSILKVGKRRFYQFSVTTSSAA